MENNQFAPVIKPKTPTVFKVIGIIYFVATLMIARYLAVAFLFAGALGAFNESSFMPIAIAIIAGIVILSLVLNVLLFLGKKWARVFITIFAILSVFILISFQPRLPNQTNQFQPSAPVENSQIDSESNKVSEQEAVITPQTSSNKDFTKSYQAKSFSFSYSNKLSTTSNPRLEDVVGVSDGVKDDQGNIKNEVRLMFVPNMTAVYDPGSQNPPLGNKTYGSNTFATYKTPSGVTIYVLKKGSKAVIITMQMNGEKLPTLVDLSSVTIK